MDRFTTQPLTAEDAQRIRGHYDRAEREEREWMEAQLHAALHGNWQGPDECPTCVSDALNTLIPGANV